MIRFKEFLLAILVIASSMIATYAQNNGVGDYYGKHVIVVVDQTLKNYTDLDNSRQAIVDWLSGKAKDEISGIEKQASVVPQFYFNDKHDQLSIFDFGMIGDGKHTNSEVPYWQIHDRCNKSSNVDIYSAISKNLIYRRGQLQESQLSLSDFEEQYLKPSFASQDALKREISSHGGITLSYYVYPCIMSFIDKKKTSSEYILLVVSDFQSGVDGKGSANDQSVLYNLVAQKQLYVDAFTKKINELKSPFVQSEFVSFKCGTVKVFGTRLVSKAGVDNPPVFISSNVDMQQTSYKGQEYDISPVVIAYNKDQKTRVDSIKFNVFTKSGELVFSKFLADKEKAESWYNADKREYKISAIDNAELGDYSSGDHLNVEYVFFTMSTDDKGADVFPYAFRATRDFEFTPNVFKVKIPLGMKIFFIVLFIALIIGAFFAYRKWVENGRDVAVSLKFHIWPIGGAKYMEVTNNEIINYDCWYHSDGQDEREIHITGDLKIDVPKFAKKYRHKIEFKIDDADQDYAFTFRPKGNEADGSPKKIEKFYPLTVDDEGHFEFYAIAYVDHDIEEPDYDEDHILNMKVTIKVTFLDGDKVIRIVDFRDKSGTNLNEQYYEFIVKPEIKNSDLWMAFDPGTSGSCVAYGHGGLPSSDDNIHLAGNFERNTHGDEYWNSVFPSMIRIHDKSAIFNDLIDADTMKEIQDLGKDGDFYFGNLANQLWGRNSFQSIKKLLGYTNNQIIKNNLGAVKEISGQDLALLLVKGLCNHFVKFLNEADKDRVSPEIRDRFFDGKKFTPSRAIVAVPNNYTNVKIQDMVDSVKRTGLFKEVHYIYESEGAFMCYLRQNWSKLPSLQKKIFVVYDMGGATINATAFKIHVTQEKQKGHAYIAKVDVETVSKVGYFVGGDDIDYAWIQILYQLPAVQRALEAQGISAEQHIQEHKKDILKFVRELKIDWIEKTNSHRSQDLTGNKFISLEFFWGEVRKHFGEWDLFVDYVDEDGNHVIDPESKQFLMDQKANHSIMTQYVLNSVDEAVRELLSTIRGGNLELILSGRSVLYPGVQDHVENVIRKDKRFVYDTYWKGFCDEKGKMDDQLVKTAVATGAGWYAMFSKYIVMHHNVVTSTFGFVDMVDDKPKFIPVVKRGARFGEGGWIQKHAVPFTPILPNIEFIQMLASDHDYILKNRIKHKMNHLDEVTADKIKGGQIQDVWIRLDDKGNFEYTLKIAGFPDIKGKFQAGDIDILSENSDVYAFAALTSQEDHSADALDATQPIISTAKKQTKNATKSGGNSNGGRGSAKRF